MRAEESRFGMVQLRQADGSLPIADGGVDRPDMTQSVQRDIRAEILKQDRPRLGGDKRPFLPTALASGTVSDPMFAPTSTATSPGSRNSHINATSISLNSPHRSSARLMVRSLILCEIIPSRRAFLRIYLALCCGSVGRPASIVPTSPAALFGRPAAHRQSEPACRWQHQQGRNRRHSSSCGIRRRGR